MLRGRIQVPAAVAGGLAAIAAIVASGAGAADTAIFVAYHALWILAPGLVAARLLVPGLDRLAFLVVGWGLGYTLAMGVYAAAAALDAPAVLWLWPFWAPAVAVSARGRMRADLGPLNLSRATVTAAVLVGLVLVVHLAAFASEEQPVAPASERVTYFQDYLWNVAYAAEAVHRWPLRDPQVSGESLPYHVGWALDAAFATRVTGAELDVVVSRLQPLPWLIALVCGFLALGRGLTGSGGAGVAGLLMFVYAGSATASAFSDYWPDARTVLLNTYNSPSFLLGAVLWLATLVLIVDLLARARAHPRAWGALVLLLAGCAAAKGPLLPLLVGGSLLAWFVALPRVRDRRLAAIGGAAAAVLIASLATIYSGGGSLLKLDPFANRWQPPAGTPEIGGLVPLTAGTAGLAVLVMAPLAGLLWLPRGGPPSWRLVLAILGTGLAATAALATAAGDEIYFLQYALIPATVLAAHGLLVQAAAREPWSRWQRAAVVVLAAAAAIGVVAASDGARWAQIALLALLAVPLARRIGALRASPLILVAVVATSQTLPSPRYELRAAERAAASLGLPVEAPPRIGFRVDRAPSIAVTSRTPVTRDVARGLRWLRDHTPPDAVVLGPARRDDVRTENDFEYAALSERRSFYGGGIFSLQAGNAGYVAVLQPGGEVYPERRSLQDAILRRCDEDALRRVVAGYGVTHLVVDRTRGNRVPACLESLGRTIYTNPDLRIATVAP